MGANGLQGPKGIPGAPGPDGPKVPQRIITISKRLPRDSSMLHVQAASNQACCVVFLH